MPVWPPKRAVTVTITPISSLRRIGSDVPRVTESVSCRLPVSRIDHSSQAGATAANDRAISGRDLASVIGTLTQRFSEQRQAAVHAVIDAGVIIRKFLIHMRYTQ